MTPIFPDDLQESKAINISLATAIFVVPLLTFIELMGIFIRTYIPEFTIWLEKLVIIFILAIVLSVVSKNQRFLQKIEAILFRVKKENDKLNRNII